MELLVDEVVALARDRARWPFHRSGLRAEFFCIDTSSGDALSLVLCDDLSVEPAIELERAANADPKEYDVLVLQVGGPRGSGVVDALVGYVARCGPGAAGELSFNGNTVPASPEVWTRGLLIGRDEGVVAFAIGSDDEVVRDSLRRFIERSTNIGAYDEVVYHFWVDSLDV